MVGLAGSGGGFLKPTGNKNDDIMPLALSVQVVDKDKTWIVAAGSHQTKQEFRDVYIEDEHVAASMIEYYDRLSWQKSVVVLDHGRITPEGKKMIEEISQSGRGEADPRAKVGGLRLIYYQFVPSTLTAFLKDRSISNSEKCCQRPTSSACSFTRRRHWNSWMV